MPKDTQPEPSALPEDAQPELSAQLTDQTTQLIQYAFVSHESAIDAVWCIAAKGWPGILDDENVWLIPLPESCVHTQKAFKQLDAEVNLSSLGIMGSPVDLLVPNRSCFSRGKQARFHVWRDYFPDKSFLRVHERVFVSTPNFAILQLATARPSSTLERERARQSAEEDARIRAELGIGEPASTPEQLLQWENISRFAKATKALCDFSGTYRYVPSESSTMGFAVDFGRKPMMSPASFLAFIDKMPASKGVMRARRVAAAAFAGCASPMETLLVLMLTLSVEMGGFGLPRPMINWQVDIDPEQRDLSSKEEIYGDLCWPKHKLDVEYEGWKDHAGAGPRKVAEDAARQNSLAALGWTVLRVTAPQVTTQTGLTLLARQVATILGSPLREPNDLERIWRSRLQALLLPPVRE
ncbi:MAG: hypothetical protein Q4A01_05845 [Coriobacteriales bacterium]|nr:hypothetical protein [Coriobacteriales bacterium]